MTSMGSRKKATVVTRMIRLYIQVGLTTAEEERGWRHGHSIQSFEHNHSFILLIPGLLLKIRD